MRKNLFLMLLSISFTFSAVSSVTFFKNYQFTNEWFDHEFSIWEMMLAPYKNKKDLQYLEIGVWEGRSFFWMLENILTHPTARASAVDLFLEPESTKRFYDNLKLSGFQNKVAVFPMDSKLIPMKLSSSRFDIIYIDGNHLS